MIIQQRHFPVCPHVSREAFCMYNQLKTLTARSASTKEYWISSAMKMVSILDFLICVILASVSFNPFHAFFGAGPVWHFQRCVPSIKRWSECSSEQGRPSSKTNTGVTGSFGGTQWQAICYWICLLCDEADDYLRFHRVWSPWQAQMPQDWLSRNGM